MIKKYTKPIIKIEIVSINDILSISAQKRGKINSHIASESAGAVKTVAE